eukprot:1812227-Rhodomonas_salina.1
MGRTVLKWEGAFSNCSTAPHSNCCTAAGDGHHRVNDLHAYAVTSMEWTVVPSKGSAPPPLESVGFCVLHGKLYVFGGHGVCMPCPIAP